MISSLRNFSKSKGGTIVMALVLVLILIGFAVGDIQNVLSGGGWGMGRTEVAKAGGEHLSQQDVDMALRRRLEQLRAENPAASNADVAKDFDPLLSALIDMTAMRAFTDDENLILSNRLLDAQIAKLPGTRGLDGKFSDQSYAAFLARQKMSDGQFRRIFGDQLLRGLILVPVAERARVPIGMARPYASMQLERREADVALVPIDLFAAKIGAPTDQQLAAYYQANKNRYMIPEQRVLDMVRIGPDQVAKVTPSDKDIAGYYNANKALYAGKAQRIISRAVLSDAKTAATVVAKLKSGTSFVDAVKPLGFSAADISLGPQTREEFVSVSSVDAANAVFANNVGAGSIVGPIRSDLGYIVAKVEGLQTVAGKTLDQARAEITAKLIGEKRTEALQEIVGRLEDATADGATLAEAAKAEGLTVVRTPAVQANGSVRGNPGYKFPAEFGPALKTGFQLDQNEPPTTVILAEGTDYAMVEVSQLVAAAPAPAAQIRDQLTKDWKAAQARDLARATATAIAGKVAKGMDVKTAVAQSGVSIPAPQHVSLRRIQLSQMNGNVPPALGMMFSLAKGRSRMVADPQGRGFVIVKVAEIVPGDATLQPQLITQLTREFEQPLSLEYAEQFQNAINADVGVKRNEELIKRIRAGYSTSN